MKKVKMFHLKGCPHCAKAYRFMKELVPEHPEYASVEVEEIEEREEAAIAQQYDYYYVPTYYVGDDKVFEGSPSKQDIERVYRMALGLEEA